MGRFIDITGAPIASDFQEMPLDFMAKALDVQQKSQDAFDTARDSIVPTESGLRTTNIIYKGKEIPLYQYEKENYDKPLEDIAKVATNNPAEATRRFGILQKQRNSDPILALAKKDFTYKPTVLADEKEKKKTGTVVYSYRDKAGKAIPINADKILAGELEGDPSEWYNSLGYTDYIKPGMDYLDKAPEMKYMLQTDKGLALEMLDQIPFYRTGKSVSNVHAQTIKNMLPTITMLENLYLDNPSAFAQRWRVDQGIEDLDHNQLVSDVEARNKATKFIRELADTKVFDNTSTVIDYNRAQLATPKGGSGDGDGNDGSTNSYLDSLGTALTKGKNGILELFKGKSSNDIKKQVTLAASTLMYSKNLQKTNPTLFALGQRFFDRNTNTIDLSKLNPYYEDEKDNKGNKTGKKILVDPLEQVRVAVDLMPDANANLFYTNLLAARQGFNLIKGAETESDAIARKRSGYTEAYEKQYEKLPQNIRDKMLDAANSGYGITISPEGNVSWYGTQGDVDLGGNIGKVSKEDIALLKKYDKEISNKKSALRSYETIRKEEYNKRTNPEYEYEGNWEGVVYSADTKGAAEKNQMDDAAWSAVENNIAGTGSKESIVTDKDGNPVDLRNKKINRDSMEVIGFTRDTDGTVKMRFSIKESETTGTGSEKSSEPKTLIMTKVPQNVANLYRKYKPITTGIKDKTTSIIASWERNEIPETDAQGNPYVAEKQQYGHTFKVQNVNGINNYTLPEAFIDEYNSMIPVGAEKISNKVGTTYNSNTLATIFANYEAAKKLQEYSNTNK
jgi:hypothetical protein